MASIWGLPSVQSVKDWESLRRFVTQSLTSITNALSNGITFSDNLRCKIVEIGPLGEQNWASPGPTVIVHGLQYKPAGYLIASMDQAASITTDASFPFDSRAVYLNSSNLSATVKIIILG